MKNVKFTDSKSRNWEYQIPFNITCNATQVTKVYTSEEYINGKIERFDGLDNLRKNYICRDAKKAGKVAPTAPVEAPTAPTEEVKPNLFEGVQPPAAPTESELPIAKQDKNGKWRNAKGHLISEFNLKNFKLVPYEAAA